MVSCRYTPTVSGSAMPCGVVSTINSGSDAARALAVRAQAVWSAVAPSGSSRMAGSRTIAPWGITLAWTSTMARLRVPAVQEGL